MLQAMYKKEYNFAYNKESNKQCIILLSRTQPSSPGPLQVSKDSKLLSMTSPGPQGLEGHRGHPAL